MFPMFLLLVYSGFHFEELFDHFSFSFSCTLMLAIRFGA